jgi:hypothetical protein
MAAARIVKQISPGKDENRLKLIYGFSIRMKPRSSLRSDSIDGCCQKMRNIFFLVKDE